MGGELSKEEERRQRLKERNDAVEKMYADLIKKRYKNHQLYSDSAVFQMIADKFFIATSTVEDIICGRHRFKKNN